MMPAMPLGMPNTEQGTFVSRIVLVVNHTFCNAIFSFQNIHTQQNGDDALPSIILAGRSILVKNF